MQEVRIDNKSALIQVMVTHAQTDFLFSLSRVVPLGLIDKKYLKPKTKITEKLSLRVSRALF